MEFIPVFNTLKRIGIDHGDYMLMYGAPGSIYFALYFPIPYVLLLLSVLFIIKKEYSIARYSLSYIPIVIAVVFVVLISKLHV